MEKTTLNAVYKYDISLPVKSLYQIVPIMKERLKGITDQVIGYGHLGDGNLHLNISSKEYSKEVEREIEPFVYEYTQSVRGSISAEHGIGQMKPDYLRFSKSDTSIAYMKHIKNIFDKNGILNPYKVLPIN